MSCKPPDFDLWTEVAQSIKPLRKRRVAKVAPVSSEKLPKPPPPLSVIPIRPHRSSTTPPPITGFDRRTTQKMTRGHVEIERRLDLHGTGIEMARMQLLHFLRSAH